MTETATAATHLWEHDHPYYCETSRWCEHQGSNRFESWAEFAGTTFFDGDRDQNFLVRWDWRPPTDLREDHELDLFFVLQRKPIFATCRVQVTPDDEPVVRAWLVQCAQTMTATWSPLLSEPSRAQLAEEIAAAIEEDAAYFDTPADCRYAARVARDHAEPKEQ